MMPLLISTSSWISAGLVHETPSNVARKMKGQRTLRAGKHLATEKEDIGSLFRRNGPATEFSSPATRHNLTASRVAKFREISAPTRRMRSRAQSGRLLP